MEAHLLNIVQALAVMIILVLIGEARSNRPLEDPFLANQKWKLSDAYKIMIPLVAVLLAQSVWIAVLSEKTATLVSGLAACLVPIPMIALYYFVIHKHYRPGMHEFGLDKGKFLKSGVATANVLFALSLAWLVLSRGPGAPPSTPKYIPHLDWALLVVVYAFLACFVLSPLEELLFRGVLYAPVVKRLGPWKAMGCLALIESLMHLDRSLLHLIVYYVFFFLLYYVYKRTRSLYGPIILHVGYNLPSSQRLVTAALAGRVEGGALDRWRIYAILAGFLIVNAYWLLVRYRTRRSPDNDLASGNLQNEGSDGSGV